MLKYDSFCKLYLNCSETISEKFQSSRKMLHFLGKIWRFLEGSKVYIRDQSKKKNFIRMQNERKRDTKLENFVNYDDNVLVSDAHDDWDVQ